MRKDKAPKPTASGKDQVKKFEDAARELGCDESEDRFKEALRKVGRTQPSKKRQSDE